ncbi:MAG: ABC transporter ATP-binding protein [Gilvibacter sp.]
MATTDSNIVLGTKQLAIGYKTKKRETSLHDNISIEFAKGSLTAVIGANGVGKSTLIRTLTKAQPALNGDIFLGATDAKSITHQEWATKVSVVHTKAAISMNLTVFELVSLGRHPYTNWIGALRDEDQTIIAHAMTVTDVLQFRDRKCHELSDGQLQRVLIARTIAQDTPVIILDEPTTHLDLHHKSYILTLLRELTKKGKTIIFSTHDIDLVIDLCDNLVVMLKDRLFFDTPQELIEQGVMNKLFGEERVIFDAKNRRFTLNK